MDKVESTEQLNDLIETLHDSHDGYRECADVVEDPSLKKIFTDLSSSRQEMINTLEQQVRRQQAEPEKTGSTLAAGHRLFIDLKALLTGGDTEAIINEVKRGESTLIENYREVLHDDDLALFIKDILENQLRRIEGDLEQIKLRAKATA